ncbi:MAG: hypothetical protein Q9160_007839 [Pyrenula sp. 1 TL-2023]
MPHALTIREKKAKAGQIYYPLQLKAVPKPLPGPNELLIKLHAAALNHRGFFIRQHLYPDISFQAPLLSDGHGTVVEVGPDCSHLTAVEGAALPSCGLTAWRALVTKSANAKPGHNLLVTGIGGGVALQVLQFDIALGCNVYVTSGTETKIARAREMGAKGGVVYKNEGWERALREMLPPERPYLDAVIDGAGGDVVIKATAILKPGGVIVCYGMTVAPVMYWPMQAMLKNIELKGSTLGSRTEFWDMINFVGERKIRPIISRTVKGLDCVDAIDDLFEDMRAGKQFGKLVIEI